MAHAQKPDFVFRRNGRVHLNRGEGGLVHSTTGRRGVRISGSNVRFTIFRSSPVSLSLPFPCVTVCHHISTVVCMYVVYVDIVVIIEMGQGINEGRWDETIGGDSCERPKTDSIWCLWYARCWIFRSWYLVVSFLISFKNKKYVFGLFWVQGF